MKASKKEMILSMALCLLPMLLGLILWKKLPEQIPTHFDLNGTANGYSSKAMTVFGLPGIMAAIDALCLFGLRSDPKADKQSEVLGKIMLWFVPALSCVLVPLCLYIALGKNINIALIIQLIVGVLFVAIGNYLPKCRRNYTMGIKIPWTLADDDNWNYTHRLGGFVYVIGGVLTLLNAFFGVAWLMFAVLGALILIPAAASYIYYRRHGMNKGE